MKNDCIAAVSTALGTAAVSVLRMSGGGCIEIADKVFTARGGKKPREFEPRKAYVGEFSAGGVSDEAMCIVFRAPNSFTGEDTAEFHCHGGTALTCALLKGLFDEGARQAEAGEFTKRAFINGKLDLTRAEGIIGLIHAQSSAEIRAAATLRAGVLADAATSLQSRLLEVMSEINAMCDYPEEYDGERLAARTEETVRNVQGELSRLAATYQTGRLLQGGVNCAIIGAPNSGKSSLMNALLCFDRAIVTDIAGTTRDTLADSFIFKDVRFNIVDTAGLRDTDDPIEVQGIARAREAASAADIVLYVVDATAAAEGGQYEGSGQAVITVCNKCDLLSANTIRRGDRVYVSAKYGTNIEGLKEIMLQKTMADVPAQGALLLTSARHFSLIKRAENALFSADFSHSLEAVYVDIMAAWRALGEITGNTAPDAVIDNLFARFCVGK